MAKVKFPKSKKKNFSSFSVSEAYKQLGIITLIPWKFESQPLPISDFFKKRLERLQKRFDLRSYEESKKLLIDALSLQDMTCPPAIQTGNECNMRNLCDRHWKICIPTEKAKVTIYLE